MPVSITVNTARPVISAYIDNTNAPSRYGANGSRAFHKSCSAGHSCVFIIVHSPSNAGFKNSHDCLKASNIAGALSLK